MGGGSGDACNLMDRDAARSVFADLDFADVNPDTDGETLAASKVLKGCGTLQRPCRPIKESEHSVSGRINLAAAEPAELTA